MPADRLYVVVPCYNEQEVLPETGRVLAGKLTELCRKGLIGEDSRVLLVDDGSADGTWDEIEKLHRADARFLGLGLSRNRGHQNALLAGLTEAADKADMTVSIDADLQDDVNAIDEMVRLFREGKDVVYGVRNDRQSDSALKRATAQGYYRLLRRMGCETVYNHADFRLLSRRALKALLEYEERGVYLRGLVPTVGFPSASVFYARTARKAGSSKYGLKKMLALAWEGITSQSVRPLHGVCFLGAAVLAAGVLLGILLAIFGRCGFVEGALLTSVWILAGLVILSVGIVGEYTGSVLTETKRRPRYFVARRLPEKTDES